MATRLIDALAATGPRGAASAARGGQDHRVPLALMAGADTRPIVMLEPRRLAARAAAERMAETLGEPVGETVGYRIRGEASCRANPDRGGDRGHPDPP
jgi:ATP-dependent helicase HrpB